MISEIQFVAIHGGKHVDLNRREERGPAIDYSINPVHHRKVLGLDIRGIHQTKVAGNNQGSKGWTNVSELVPEAERSTC